MIARLLCVLVLALIASASAAQSVKVRSADHVGFSRIVLYFPGRTEWHWEGKARERTLRVGRAGLRFDVSQVFDKMSNTHVEAVTPLADPPGLRLDLACDCRLEAAWHGTSMLVIDISDPAPDVPPPAERPLALMASQTAAALAAPRLAPDLQPQDLPELASGQPQPPATPETAPILSAAREILAQQIARAAGLGLVTARPAIAPPAAGQDEMPPVAEVEEATPAPAVNVPDHMSAENSIDRAFAENAPQPRNPVGNACTPDHLLNVPGWGTSAPFGLQVGSLRARLLGEFDRVQRDAVADLARLYVFFGFGAEALEVLDLDPDADPPAVVLRELALILDDRPAGTVLRGQTDCDSDAALWSALAHDRLGPGMVLDVDAMLRALERLPLHLRQVLGPQLAHKLLGAGQDAAAERVLRILDRGPTPATPAQAFLHAETMPDDAAPAAVDAALADVVEENAENAAQALIRRIDRRIRLGQGVPDELAQLAGAYALEQRSAATGPELARVYIEATAAAGDFETAFDEMDRLAPELSPEIRDRVLTTLLGLGADAADDIGFLSHALRLRDVAPERIAPEAANRVARRLLDLGFPADAAFYLRAQATGPEMRDRQMLRAEVALSEGRPQQAQVEVLGLTGEDVNLLRARAQAMVGRHRAAHALFLGAGEADAATSEAMRAGDWQEVQAIADPALADMAQLVAAASADEPEDMGQGILARNQALLEEAAAARGIVERLLQSRPGPEATD